MPAIMDDPDSPTIYRTSGSAPFPDPHNPNPSLPPDIFPRQVTLRDRITIATVVPFSSRHQVPPSLLAYLSDQFAREIENGDTYPMMDPLPLEKFSSYWFQNFGAIMLLGSIESPSEVVEGRNWATECLGSFYIKPNYPGRSSHVCNAGFLVTEAARNKGVGRLMGETYIDWAPKLGYTYSVFNLVYETNVASCRIWDALGFKRIGRVKGCGNLKSYPGRLIDALIYGRDLLVSADDLVSEARFDKIKFYLQNGKYPAGSDRAEKSRLRSSATHYKLLDDDRLMLKDKEVVSDPSRQYELAKMFHMVAHAGINKTTAKISERYHWVRIKETVSLVIKNCPECKELFKPATPVKPFNPNGATRILPTSHLTTIGGSAPNPTADPTAPPPAPSHDPGPFQTHTISASPSAFQHRAHSSSPSRLYTHHPSSQRPPPTKPSHPSQRQHHHRSPSPDPDPDPDPDAYLPLDPQIMSDSDVQHHLSAYDDHSSHHHSHSHHHHSTAFTDHEADHANDEFRYHERGGSGAGVGVGVGDGDGDGDATDRELDLLLEGGDVDVDVDVVMGEEVDVDVEVGKEAG